MGHLSTHVLDLAAGAPAEGVPVVLRRMDGGRSIEVASATTNRDGRTDAPLLEDDGLVEGSYVLEFHVGDYLRRSAGQGRSPFFDVIPVCFHVDDASQKYHVPLLLSGWGYTTYRGS